MTESAPDIALSRDPDEDTGRQVRTSRGTNPEARVGLTAADDALAGNAVTGEQLLISGVHSRKGQG